MYALDDERSGLKLEGNMSKRIPVVIPKKVNYELRITSDCRKGGLSYKQTRHGHYTLLP